MATQITSNREPDYNDLDLDFMRNPKTDLLILKTGREAVKRSVRNLIMTNYYERPFQSYIGSGIRELLFENFTPMTTILLEDRVRLTLQNFEPRVSVENVSVYEDIDNNGFSVNITYIIKNTNEPIVTSLFLERIR
jgi:phage baseplate assembly protein W